MSYSEIIRKNAHASLALGIPPAFPKADIIAELGKRAEEIRLPHETKEGSFVRAMTSDPIGKALFRVSKAASGPDHIPVETKPEPPLSRGPAHDQMQRLAQSHNDANPGRTFAQSYNAVYCDPKNRDLAQKVTAEHLLPSLVGDGSDGDVTKRLGDGSKFRAEDMRERPDDEKTDEEKEAEAREKARKGLTGRDPTTGKIYLVKRT